MAALERFEFIRIVEAHSPSLSAIPVDSIILATLAIVMVVSERSPSIACLTLLITAVAILVITLYPGIVLSGGILVSLTREGRF